MGNKTERLAYQICSRTPCPYDKTGEPHEVSLDGVRVCFYTLEPKQPKAEEKAERIEKLDLQTFRLAASPETLRALDDIEDKINEIIEVVNKK